MTRSLWFLVPADGRHDLTAVCLRQLARTCAALTENGIHASAIVVASDANLDTAAALGFGTIQAEERDRLGRRWNDALELAGRTGVDYVVPFGSDDWIDPTLILTAPLPAADEIVCFRRAAFVREDGARLAPVRVPHTGGLGIRIIPAGLLARAGFRPAAGDETRHLDRAVWHGLARALGRQPRPVYHDLHALQIVDWKSGTQLHPYADCLRYLDGTESRDPLGDLAEVYPAGPVGEMRALYENRLAVAA